MNIEHKISFGKTEEECKQNGFNYLCKENRNVIGSCCNTQCDKRGDKLNGFCKIEKIENIRENYENNSINKKYKQKNNMLKLTVGFLKMLIVILLISIIIFGLTNCKNI
jgi:hypothetical protein